MMSPAYRTTLSELIKSGDLKPTVSVDAEMCRRLIVHAGRHLLTIASALTHDDFEGAYQLAYDAGRKVCLALVLTASMRPAGDYEHATTFEAAADIAAHFSARKTVDDAADLRLGRHDTEYRAVEVSETDAREALAIAEAAVHVIGEGVEHALTTQGL